MNNIYTVTELDGFAHDIIAKQSFVDQYYPNRWVLVGPEPKPVVVLPNIITKVAFRFRLTDAEYIGILTKAKTDMTVKSWLDTFYMVSQIELDHPKTKSGVESLVTAGLLTEQRAFEILNDPIQPGERPQ
jgi:hypothetical protein